MPIIGLVFDFSADLLSVALGEDQMGFAWVFLVTLVFLFVGYGVLFFRGDFFQKRRRSKVPALVEALKSDYVDPVTKSFFEDELSAEYLKLVWGVRFEQPLRGAVIQAHRHLKGEVGFSAFKAASPYLTVKDDVLKVNLPTSAFVEFLFYRVYGVLVALLAILIFSAVIFSQDLSVYSRFGGLVLAVFSLFLSVVLLLQSRPYHLAKIIRDKLG